MLRAVVKLLNPTGGWGEARCEDDGLVLWSGDDGGW